MKRKTLAAALAIALNLVAGCATAQYVAPASSQTPYIVPTAPGWQVTSLISVGDAALENGYRMVGIPDGLGALAGKFDPDSARYVADKAFMTIVMNHELGAGSGAVRAHGRNGAFVSQWTVHLNTLEVRTGEDLITKVMTWNGSAFADTTGATGFNRFCSASLAPRSAFFNAATGKGFDGDIFMNGEEAGAEGRAFAHILGGAEKGTSYELPALGKFSWENAIANPSSGDRTIVVGTDDSTPGQVYVYVGTKSDSGNPAERAGLHGGKLYGMRIANGGGNYANGPVTVESQGAINGAFVLAEVTDAVSRTGAQIQAASAAAGIVEFARPEDAAWDPTNPRSFYFVTTGATIAGRAQTSKLYRVTLDSVENPTSGSIEMVLDSATLVGTDGQGARMFDNIAVDGAGDVMIQEDPGNSAYVAKVWKLERATGIATQVFSSDPARFTAPGTPPFNVDEENSGVIEVTDTVRAARWFDPTRRYYLGVMQAHYANGHELVEGGQLYLMASPGSGRRK